MALTKLQSFNIDSTANFTFANLTSGNANLGNTVTANYFIGNLHGTANIATIANSVDGANVTGNVANALNAFAVSGANVSGAVSFATTANSVSGANVTGNVGNALNAFAVSGANVTGTVANSTFATTAGNLSSSTISVTGNIIPTANITYNLGSPTARFKDIYLSGNTIDLAGATIKTDETTGAIALIPQPTVAVPNPSGVVITSSGRMTAITTINGVVSASEVSSVVANAANLASTSYVDSAISNLVASSPAALDTLNELANALGNDANYSTTITNALANKLSTTNFASTANIWISTQTTGNVSEGTNLYYTVARSNTAIDNRVTTSFVNNLSITANTANSVAGANVSGQVSNALIAGTVYTNAQPNITSVGTLTSLDVTGNITAGNISGNGSQLSAINFSNITTFSTAGLTTDKLYLQSTTRLNVTASGTSGYLFDQYGETVNPVIYVTSGQTIAFNLSVSSNPFLIQTSSNLNYSVGLEHVSTTGTVSSISSAQGQVSGTLYWKVPYGIAGNYKYQCSVHASMTGNIVVTDANIANVSVSLATFANTANIANTANAVVGSNVTGQVANALVAGTVYSASQPNITSVGNLTSLAVGGTVTAVAFIANTYFSGNGNGLSNINGASVTGAVDFAKTANAVAGANVSGAVAYATTANAVAGANVSGAVNYAITANNVAGANVSGAVSFATTANAVAGANVSGQVGNSLVASTVYTNAQPNITSVGTLSNLTSNGTVNFTNASNVTLGAVGNVKITGGANGQFLQTDGSGTLTWSTVTGGGDGGGASGPASITNGNSSVDIPTANGNIGISVTGIPNVVVVTSTGANVNGYLRVTGNTSFTGANVSLGNVSNLHISGGSTGQVLSTDGAGNLYWNSSSGSSGVGSVQEFSASTGQTSFNITGGYQVGSAIVFINTVQQNSNTYTATDGIVIVLSQPSTLGDVIKVVYNMPALNVNNFDYHAMIMGIVLGT
jgi:hypothetical protein